MKRSVVALLLALWAAPALAQLGPGGPPLGPSGGGSGGSIPAGSIAIGTTAITGGTTTRVLYDNAGFVGEYTNTQLTALINAATSSLPGALPAFPGNTTTFFRGDGTYTALNLAAFPTQATNTVLGNATSGTAVPTALAVGTCSTASSALIWTTNTGFGCNTSITASAVAVGGITGLGTGVSTALAIAVGSAGGPVTNGGALGTPSSGTATNLTGLPLSGLATQATNTVVGNATSGTAVPTALAVGTCSTAASALIWTTNTGFGCNTSITAAAVPASGITGTTLASNVVTSSLTSVGTLTGGATGAGFTIAATTSTWTGTIPAAQLPAPKIVTVSRDLTVASGNVAYTGCGFAPRALIATGGVSAGPAYALRTGMAASAGGVGNSTLYQTGAGDVIAGQFIAVYDSTGTAGQTAVVASYDSDGFTLTWTKTSTPSGTATFYVMCLR